MQILSKFDIYKQPLKLTMKKGKSLSFENGSVAGFFLGIILLGTSISYVVSQCNEMNSYNKDIYKSEIITNSMKEYGELNILDFNFMPTIELMPWGDIHEGDEFSF